MPSVESMQWTSTRCHEHETPNGWLVSVNALRLREQMKAFQRNRNNYPTHDYAIFVHSTPNEKKKKKGKKEIAQFSGRHSAVREKKFHLCQQWRQPADDRNNLNEFSETHLWPTFQFASIWMWPLIRLVQLDVLGRCPFKPFLWRRFKSTI